MRKRALAGILSALVISTLAQVAAPAASAAPTVIRDFVVTHDGTKIVYNLFLPYEASASNPVPIIFQTHGWGGSGSASLTGFNKTLVEDNGYALITWDSRGFGQSSGESYVNDPGHEGLDAVALVDLVAKRADIQKDGPNDPRMGMIGGSYAGGIQLALAAFDKRVDAIVPNITWNDLRYSLFPGGVIKLGYDTLLYGAGAAGAVSGGLGNGTAGPQAGFYSTDLNTIEVKGLANGYGDADTLAWFKGRSMAGYSFGHPVNIPTLLTQGNSDALFNVNEAVANFKSVAATGAPTKLVVFCGGHVACPSNYTNTNPTFNVNAATLAWLNKYVKAQTSIDTGAAVDYINNDGSVGHAATIDEFVNGTSSSSVSVTGRVVSSGAKTSLAPNTPGVATIQAATPSRTDDPGTITVDTGLTGGQKIAGTPHFSGTVNLTGPGAHLFFKFLDRESNQVIDLQEAAIRLEASGPVELDLVTVNYVIPAGHHIDLQVSTSSSAMAEYRGTALADITGSVTVPLV